VKQTIHTKKKNKGSKINKKKDVTERESARGKYFGRGTIHLSSKLRVTRINGYALLSTV